MTQKKRSKKAAGIPLWAFAIVFLTGIIFVVVCILIGIFKPGVFNNYKILIEFISVLILILVIGLPTINCIIAIKRIISNIIKKSNRSQRGRGRSRKTTGFAETKEYPTRKHPANYKRQRGSDSVEYITFTHSKEVDIGGNKIKTIPLTSNINPAERGTLNENGEPNISYAYPQVFKGKRSALGAETDKYSLTSTDKEIVDKLFATLPRVEVRYTSNSKKKTPRK